MTTKQVVDTIAITITTVLTVTAIYLLVTKVIAHIPLHVWLDVGSSLLFGIGATIGFWSFFRTIDVLEQRYRAKLINKHYPQE